MTDWKPIKGSKGKARWRRFKVGKQTYEEAQKKVGSKWKLMYKYAV